jgi:hypothetical protein
VAFPTGEQAEAFIRTELRCRSIIGLMGTLVNGYSDEGCTVYDDHVSERTDFAMSAAVSNRSSMAVGFVPVSRSNICIALSKEKQGLPLSISRCCDSLAHVPHLPFCDDIPLLDITSCLSIMLSLICEKHGCVERQFHGHKFDVLRPTHNFNTVDDTANDTNTNSIQQRTTSDEHHPCAVKVCSADDTVWNSDILFGSTCSDDY